MRTLGIDASLTGTGLALLDDNTPAPLLETVDVEGLVGIQRVHKIVRSVMNLVQDHNPDLIVMEDYSYGSNNTNNLTRLAELGGAITWVITVGWYGYDLGFGHGKSAAELELYKKNINSSKLFIKQSVMGMKKFCLGKGDIKKDKQYLGTVKKATGLTFQDDNQADAYMHAYMGSITLAVLRGKTPMSLLTQPQQEVLFSAHRDKKAAKVSLGKMLKMSDADKLTLITS